MSFIKKAVEVVGGQTQVARLLKTKQSVVWHWVNRHGQAPAKYINKISKLTNGQVSVSELLSDHEK
ncbi:transcriptional regulator [Pseudoalteromonas sp. GCY]|uniref:YdaS family helix-turn-helix protein n=1 Tax=Pseudoalteromonas sp. GCY TaxID=2003316 RepID=UPI000BFEF5F4|nr:YdaS family helix-turn-helix protein [Pseudoalteromonas sp. GCY]PHI36323.1 transcriptional regulator [Pseudoalteromonas sp. GCY]QQQ66917.1 helix-turn-helix domain-containing protein [Pseudoalteromonas sp. GCY]